LTRRDYAAVADPRKSAGPESCSAENGSAPTPVKTVEEPRGGAELPH
jgi:hypothetical protein